MTDTPLPQEIIRRKRDGHPLSRDELDDFVRGIVDGSVGEGQMAAFAMAVWFRGLDQDERIHLTRAMTQTGTVLDWAAGGLHGPVLDKHSTGGVGDKVSLILAPLVAACGGYVPMISGRGLGHTGGTLDKLESIPGYHAAPDLGLFRWTVRNVGCAIIGQTPQLAPADRRLYAVRDVTATVDCPGLIVASILSKKLAAGLDGLVMDVKTGSGAFMTDLQAARELATALVAVAGGAGLPTRALLTDMDQVLGHAAGNALEVLEVAEFLSGARRDPRLYELVLALGAELLTLGGLADSPEAARQRLTECLDRGGAAERFAKMVAALGGPGDLLERPHAHLPHARVVEDVPAAREGVVAALDVRSVGLIVVGLGGGRRGPGDRIDPAVGLSLVRGIGEPVGPDRPLARVHAANAEQARRASAALRRAMTVADTAPAPAPVVRERLA